MDSSPRHRSAVRRRFQGVSSIVFLCSGALVCAEPPVKMSAAQAFSSNRAVLVSSNPYVEIALDSNGEFTIGTTQGDPARPSDNNKKLLYGHPFPGTTDAMVRVDGVTYQFGQTGTPWTLPPQRQGSALICERTYAGVTVRQTLAIVKSKGTRYPDTVAVSYTLRNTRATVCTAAVRLQLDTMLGDNDGAPFRIINTGRVTTDYECFGSSIPPYVHVFDNLSNPTVFALLSLTGVGFRDPDRVVFGYWPVAVNAWEYTVVPGRSFLDNNGDGVISGSSPDSDSSVIVWWGVPAPLTLAPGEETTVGLLYGLGGVTFVTWKPFNIGVVAPSELELLPEGTGYRYLPDPFIVTAYVENTAGTAVSGARATLNLPPELFLAPGESAVKPVPPVPAAGDTQINWRVRTFGKHNGERLYSVTVDAGGDSKTVPRAVTVPGRAGCAFGRVTDNRNTPLPGSRLELVRNGAVLGTVTARDNGTYLFGRLAPGRYDVRAVRDGFIAAMVPAEVTNDDYTSAGTHFSLLAPPAPSAMESFPYPNPVRQGDAHIAYHLAAAARAVVRIFTPDGILLEETAVDNAQAGWNEFRWNINGRANGVYYYVVESGGAVTRGKIAVAKWNR